MAVGCPMLPLILSDDEIQQLQSIANSRPLPHSNVRRTVTALAFDTDETNTALRSLLHIDRQAEIEGLAAAMGTQARIELRK